MADPFEFEGCNANFGPPKGREHDVRNLPLHRNGVANTFAMKFTEEELKEINETGMVFVTVSSGNTFYPIYVGLERHCKALAAEYGPVWGEKNG